MVTVEMAVSRLCEFYANGRGGPIQNRRLQCRAATIGNPGKRMYLRVARQAKGGTELSQAVQDFLSACHIRCGMGGKNGCRYESDIGVGHILCRHKGIKRSVPKHHTIRKR